MNIEVKDFDKNVQFEIGHRIQGLRLKNGIAGADLAAYMDIGRNQLSRIENGKANCTLPQLFVLSQVLKCSIDYILFGDVRLTISYEQSLAISSLLDVFRN